METDAQPHQTHYAASLRRRRLRLQLTGAVLVTVPIATRHLANERVAARELVHRAWWVGLASLLIGLIIFCRSAAHVHGRWRYPLWAGFAASTLLASIASLLVPFVLFAATLSEPISERTIPIARGRLVVVTTRSVGIRSSCADIEIRSGSDFFARYRRLTRCVDSRAAEVPVTWDGRSVTIDPHDGPTCSFSIDLDTLAATPSGMPACDRLLA